MAAEPCAGVGASTSGAAVGLSAFRLRLASRLLHAGAVLAYPTEGVFGVGCDPDDEAAVKRVVGLKRRSARKGLILVAASEDQVFRYALPLGTDQLARVRATWPGPVTWVMPARESVSRLVTGGRSTVAVRVTDHPVARALCVRFGGALVSTSANLSGRPPARSAVCARRHLGGLVDDIVPGRVGGASGPSTICDVRTGAVLRGTA